MGPRRLLFLLPLLPALALVLVACVEEGAPPATAQSATDVPPPEAPPAPTRQAPAPAQDDAKYASAEYAVGENADVYDDNDPSALKDFRGTLDPYGAWVDDTTYGTVWVPTTSVVGADFTPYATAGHWVYDDDWVWVSDYPWGWAPFHYGRWVFVGTLGWAWIPGRTYAGAWVVWRAGVPGWGYVGWAPTPPTWIWRYGRSAPLALRPRPPYVYVPHRNLLDHDVHGFASRGPSAVRIERHTRELSRPPAPPRPPRMGPAGPHPRR